jgi:hypothetical protein
MAVVVNQETAVVVNQEMAVAVNQEMAVEGCVRCPCRLAQHNMPVLPSRITQRNHPAHTHHMGTGP